MNALLLRILIGMTFAILPVANAFADFGQYYDWIIKIEVPDDNFLWINVSGNFSTSHGCPTPWYARSKYPLSDDRTKAMMQIALASFLSKSKVYVTTSGCTPEGYPIMKLLQMEQ